VAVWNSSERRVRYFDALSRRWGGAEDTSNKKIILYDLLNTTVPHLDNFYTYRKGAFGATLRWQHWGDKLRSGKKKMGAAAFARHLKAMKAALGLDIAAFHELMLSKGKDVEERIGALVGGVENVEEALREEHAKVVEEMYKLSERQAEIKQMQTVGLQTLDDLRTYLLREEEEEA
jgi:Spy/CpxP family protein refolding chaperone